MESEIFFDALALNFSGDSLGAERRSGGFGGSPPRGSTADGEELLGRFSFELATAFAARADQLTEQGRLLPGAGQAVAEVSCLHGVVQSVLTGTIKPNAVLKLRAFGLDRFFDTEVGGYGSQVYPKGAQLLMTRTRAAEKYGAAFGEDATVYIADSTRDVEAARTGGARCLAVASGRSSVSELRAAGADAVFGDLTDTAAVVAAVDRLTLAAAG
jgi:phosphoglycolate phosphatase